MLRRPSQFLRVIGELNAEGSSALRRLGGAKALIARAREERVLSRGVT